MFDASLRLALECGVALRLEPDGSVEVLGRLNAGYVRRRRSAPHRAAISPSDGAPAALGAAESLPLASPPVIDERRLLQRAIKDKNLIPMKRVAYEMGVSVVTLWRASKCDLPDFPKPVVIRTRIYWWKSELNALEDALMYYEGRGAFEQRRRASETP